MEISSVSQGDYRGVVVVFVISLAITIVALLLQAEYGRDRSKRVDELGDMVQAALLAYVKPASWTLWFGALVFSLIVSAVVWIVLDVGAIKPAVGDQAGELVAQIKKALLFVLVPAYSVSLMRIYAAATRGALSARTFLEATVDVLLASLLAVAGWLFWAIWGGLAPLGRAVQPYALLLCFAVGVCPSVTLIRMWTAKLQVSKSLLGVDGLDPSQSARLFEAGVRNLQNLAHADPGALFAVTGLQLLWIVDWVAQAQLRVMIGTGKRGDEGLARLRQLGVNNILDLEKSLDARDVQLHLRAALAEKEPEPIAMRPSPSQEKEPARAEKAPGPIYGILPSPPQEKEPAAPSMQKLIQSNPSFRVLQNYAAFVEKPPVHVDEVARVVDQVARVVDQVVHGATLINYSGYLVLSLSDAGAAEGVQCRASVKFTTKADNEQPHVVPVRISDGQDAPSSDTRVPFEVKIGFRPATIASRALKIAAPLKGESAAELLDVANPRGGSIEILVRILQANRLIQTMHAKFPDT